MGDSQEISKSEGRQLRLPDGRWMGYVLYGDPQGSSLLAIHGTPGARIMMQPAQPYALQNGICLIAPDRPGYGLSSACPNYSFAQWAADIEVLLAFLKIDKFRLFGVSGGGPFATALAALIPDRVLGVALVSPVGLFDEQVRKSWSWRHYLSFGLLPHYQFLTKLLVALTRFLLFSGPSLFVKIFAVSLGAPDRLIISNPLYREPLLDAFREGLRGGGEGVFEDLRLFGSPWQLPLEKITMPVLLWQGLEDRMVPAQAALKLARSLSAGQTVELPGQGHFWVFEHFEEVLERLMALSCDEDGHRQKSTT